MNAKPNDSKPIYIATVCLERNRWGNRQPSFKVSEWLDRFAADGFAGIELWEFHYHDADDAERARLIEQAAPIALFNTYARFIDGEDPAAERTRAAKAIADLKATGVKYNLSRDSETIDQQRQNLLAWADEVPDHCRLLCECHPGTVLETADAAAAFYDGLDPVRFGVMAHLSGDAAGLDEWLTKLGPRLQHLHLQHRDDATHPTAAGREAFEAGVAVLNRHRFEGSASIEFTRGIGKEEQIETVYANALVDRSALAEAWR